MTRQTSIDCYNQIKAEGLLSKMRFRVYEAIYHLNKCTAGEIFDYIGRSMRHSAVSARLTELRELGVVGETGVRECRVTGRNVIEFDLTDRLPGSLTRKKTTKQKIKEIREMLLQMRKDYSKGFDMFLNNDINGIIEYIDKNFEL